MIENAFPVAWMVFLLGMIAHYAGQKNAASPSRSRDIRMLLILALTLIAIFQLLP